MNMDRDWDKIQLEKSLQEISTIVSTVAKQCEGDSHCLLALLRMLESVHREIREELFEPSLPNTRNALAKLLREIEETGGWPYIERMRLQAFLKQLAAEKNAETGEQPE
jgi:hypothetical protein